jgi:phosphatidylglycerol:prolipoprotein diacylglycerol transferase
MMPLVITFPFSPILFQIGPFGSPGFQVGPFPIRWYGLGYAVAFLVGLWLAGRYLSRHGVTERNYGNMAFWAIVVGLATARLYYVIQNGFGWYLTHPQHILALWEGGMAYFGAVFAVPVFLFFYCRRQQMPFWIVADAAALFAAAGQPIGRIGNIFNGDVVGYPSDLPWAVRYTSPDTFAPELGVAYQPAAAYELLVGLAILTILLVAAPKLRAGGLFLAYLGLYAGSQFFIFFLRNNSITALGLKQGQLSALALGIITLVLWGVWRYFKTSGGQASESLPEAESLDGQPGEGITEDNPAPAGS